MRIIPRAEWGARHPNGAGTAPLPARQCWLHHSATIAPDVVPPFDDDFAAVRMLEQIGQDRFGQGMSYTWLITPAGLIFEGHGVGRLGAHTAGRNSIARAICFIGNYETATPTTAQLRAAAWLLQVTHAAGWLDEARLDGGHRDVKATACPGARAYAVIDDINALAAGPPITTLEDDMQLTDKVKAWDTDETGDIDVTVGDALYGIHWHAKHADQRTARIEVKLAELTGEIRDDEADIIAAVRAIVAADQDTALTITDDQVRQLVALLAAALPAAVTVDQMQAAVRAVFADAGQPE